MSFKGAITQLGIPLSNDEAAELEASKNFRESLDREQMVYYQELAQSPEFNKFMIVGEMLHCIKQMVREAEYDKAVEALFKLAKVQDWVGAETNINILTGISQKDIEEARKRRNQTPEALQGLKEVSTRPQ